MDVLLASGFYVQTSS